MYSADKSMKKLAKKEFGDEPTNDDVIVNTGALYKEYFRSNEGSKR